MNSKRSTDNTESAKLAKLKAPHLLKANGLENDSWKLKLKKYALLSAGVLTLGVKQAKAAIVYTDIDPDLQTTAATAMNPVFQIDVDGGGNDFGVGFYEYYYYYNGSGFTSIYGQFVTLRADFKFSTINGSSTIEAVASGGLIGPTTDYGNPSNNTISYYGAYHNNGGISYGTQAYVGFKMDASGGGTLYGWARILLTENDFTLMDYAYEDTPDTPIQAGDMGIVPIELINFEVKAQNNKARLLWKTASEVDNFGFEIQRSSNGTQWEDIGFVPGNGTTNTLQEYYFIDDDNLSATHYYRLKQIDRDRTFEYSPIRSISFENKTKDLKVFPNPAANGIVHVAFDLTENSEAEILLFDAQGSLLSKDQISGTKGNNQFELATDHLQSGIYFVEVKSANGATMIKRLVKQ